MRESSDIMPQILILCLTWIKVASCTLRSRYPRPSNCQTGSLESPEDGRCTVVKWRITALASKTTLLIQSGHLVAMLTTRSVLY